MDSNKFATWAYNHDGPGERLPWQWWIAGIGLGIALIAAPFALPVTIFFGAVALILFFRSDKKLYVGPRYLICGEKILYYANVQRITLDERKGELHLWSQAGRALCIERSRCPTNARKSDKIARNQALKFGKLSGRIIERVLRAVPAVETSGIDRSTFSARGRG